MKFIRYSPALGSFWRMPAPCLNRTPVNYCRNLGFSYRSNVTIPAHSSPTSKSLGSPSEAGATGHDTRASSSSAEPETRSIYARTAEVDNNWVENRANRWYEAESNPDDNAGHCAFQRLRQKWFTPRISPKFSDWVHNFCLTWRRRRQEAVSQNFEGGSSKQHRGNSPTRRARRKRDRGARD